jgi:hypothetical protein
VKAIRQAQTREILDAYNKENISYSRMNEMFNELADQFAIGFAHFLAEHTYSCYDTGWSNDFGHKDLTTKELLEIYKKEK